MNSRTIQYGVLGSLSIQRDGSPVSLNAPTLRQLLALLLARSNHLVSTDHLISALWADTPPVGARKAIQVYMHRLRQALGDDERVRNEGGGYCLATTDTELDSGCFEALVDEALRQRDAGRLEQAADLLQQAFGLWRGGAYEGLSDHPFIVEEARRLEEKRLYAATERVGIELDLGRHVELIPRLLSLIELHPFHEDLRGQLMLSLYRSGRQAEALEEFLQARKLLVEELAVEPGHKLRQLHSAILRGSPELDLPTKAPQTSITPRELPPAVAGFAGRAAQISRLDELLALDGATNLAGRGPQLSALDQTVLAQGNGTSMPTALITGSGGVGKTALALHWAHKTSPMFPDGQLFIDLRGHTAGAQMRPIDALTTFLRALGLPYQQIPVDLAAATALFRSQVAGRRILVVLDNARSAEDVRTLLPGSPGCLAVVTSRDRLTGLVARDGAVRVPLDVLTPTEAHRLIADLLADSTDESDSAAIARLAKVCAYLPLAIRIAIADMLNRPGQTVAEQAARLMNRGALGTLSVEGDESAAVRGTFELSYQAVSIEAKLLFRRLGLVPCPDYTAESAAALTDLSESHAEKLLELLADAHLISPLRSGRYVLHDLLREFAHERCIEIDDSTERAEAIRRVFDRLFGQTKSAQVLLYPYAFRLQPPTDDWQRHSFEDPRSALQWLDDEHANVVAAVRFASSEGPKEMAWLLAANIRSYFDFRRSMGFWFATARAGLAAARSSNDQQAQAAMLHMLGHAYGAIARHDIAEANFRRAKVMSERCGWLEGSAMALGALGVLKGYQGWPAEAAPLFFQALRSVRQLQNGGPEVTILNNLAACHWQLGNLHEALAFCDEALSNKHELGAKYENALTNRGVIAQLLGQLDSALHFINQAIIGHRRRGNRPVESHAYVYRSGVLLDVGRMSDGLDSAMLGIHEAREIGFKHALIAGLTELGRYLRLNGDLAGALEALAEAIEIATAASVGFELSGALIRLSEAQTSGGDEASACVTAQNALDLATDGGFRIRQGQALVALARATLSTGDRASALQIAMQALDIQRHTGYLIGAAEAHHALAQAQSSPAVAVGHAARALAIYRRTGAQPPRDLQLDEELFGASLR